MRGWLVVIACCVACGCATSCATSREREVWHQWLLDADADFDHGDLARAHSIYARLAQTAPTPDLSRYIEYKLAVIAAVEAPAEGVLLLRDLADAPNPLDDPWSSQALMAIKDIYEAQGDTAKARAVAVEIVTRFPDDPVTPRALNEVLLDYRARDDLTGAQGWLAQMFVLHAETDLGDNLLYEIIRIELEDRKRPAEAEVLLRRHQKAYPFSGLHDDVTFKLAHLLIDQGRFDEALEQLETIATMQDEAWSVGNYDPPLRDDAMLLRADIFLRTDRPQMAFDEYGRLLSTFPDYLGGSRVARLQLDLLRGPLADRAQYIDALEGFIETYPDSVYTEDLRCRLQLARAQTPLDEIPAKAKDAKPCTDPN